jgi:methylmalonyl-CoA mutase
MVRAPGEKKRLHLDRLRDFEKRNRETAPISLDRLGNIVESGGNTFAELIETVEHCSLGQITERLSALVGKFRPMV